MPSQHRFTGASPSACALLQGADIICVPNNWVPIPGQAEGSPAMAPSSCRPTPTAIPFTSLTPTVLAPSGSSFSTARASSSVTPAGPMPGQHSLRMRKSSMPTWTSVWRESHANWNDFNPPARPEGGCLRRDCPQGRASRRALTITRRCPHASRSLRPNHPAYLSQDSRPTTSVSRRRSYGKFIYRGA